MFEHPFEHLPDDMDLDPHGHPVVSVPAGRGEAPAGDRPPEQQIAKAGGRLMRRYDEEIAVQHATGHVAGGDGGQPGRFLWRGRLYVVRGVLAHWVELGAWWRQRDQEGLPVHVDGSGREVWRVEARAGGSSADGVYDLAYDAGDGAGDGRWSLTRALD